MDATVRTAIEFGYRQCEKGDNLDKTLEEAQRILDEGEPEIEQPEENHGQRIERRHQELSALLIRSTEALERLSNVTEAGFQQVVKAIENTGL